MIYLAVRWLLCFLLDLFSMLNVFSDCAFRSLARSGLTAGGPADFTAGAFGALWSFSGRSRGALGWLLGGLGRSWGVSGRSWVPPARFLHDGGGDFGTILRRF